MPNSRWIQVPVTGITLWAALQLGLPQLARSAPLDELSGTLGGQVQDVMNQQVAQQLGGGALGQAGGALEDRVRQTIGNTVSDQLGNLTGSIGDAVGGVFGNLGGGGLGGDLVRQVLAPVQGILMNYLNVYSTEFGNMIQTALGNILGQTGAGGDVAQGVTGPLNIADFLKLHKKIDEQASQGSANGDAPPQMQQIDRYNINPSTLAQSLKFEADRTQSTAMAAGILSSEGQLGVQKEMDMATKTLQQIQASNQDAQRRDVTQDVMKDLTAITASQSALQAGTYSQIIALRTQNAADSVVQSNISAALDEMNRRNRSEAAAAADQVLRNAAQIYLPGLEKR